MINERDFLASEVHLLKELLAATPQSRLIERISLQSRLDNVQAELDGLPASAPVQKARLTFRGRPVFGSRGIAADFAGQAATKFADAFTAIAAELGGKLSAAGPIPDKEKNQLRITGTAIGSFGFELELPTIQQQALIPEEASPENTMLKMEALLRLAATGSDDELAEVVEQTHKRAVGKVCEFMQLLAGQEAWCGLEFANRYFCYASHEQLVRSCERLIDENIREGDVDFRGAFQGVLPTGRTFEFQPEGESELIRGRIDRSFAEPDILNRHWLHSPASVTFHFVQVGQGRPRYSLMSLESVKK